MRFLTLFLIALLTLSSASFAKDDYRVVSWDDLMPEGWVPEPPPDFFGYDETNQLELDQPELDQPETEQAWLSAPIQTGEIAPVVETLNKQNLKLPGYIIPTKFNEDTISEFLLVPFIGACIHVPPPPENQMVYVTLKEPMPTHDIWAPVWVSGLMTTQVALTKYATAGYHMKGATTEVYEY